MSKEYGAAQISVLKGLQAIQARPGMYVGDISSIEATHHLLYETFDNAVDEALGGHARRIDVVLHRDGSASVSDDGRGIPVDLHPELGLPAVEVVLTTLHAGGKFDSDSYAYSGGLHGVGISCVAALSDWMDVTIRRDGAIWAIRLENGEVAKKLRKIGTLPKGRDTGTTVRFLPSPRYLRETLFDRDTLLSRFREVAFLNAGVEIGFTDERGEDGEDPWRETFRFDNGMADFAAHIAAGATPIVPVACFSGHHGDTGVDVAFTWVEEDRGEDLRAYANNIPQADGGQHVTGFRAAVTRALMGFAERAKLVRRGSRVSPEDLREGLAGALHVRLVDPAFSSQTKEKLISTEARAGVEAVLEPAFSAWLDTHPEAAALIFNRAQAAAEAREAAKKARQLSRTKKAGARTSSAALPEKLADCSARDPMRRELFLVEGDSAGGSAKQGRDREIQAILPLRGKILNVERARQSQVLKNAEIAAMIQTLGAGIGARMDLSRLRYGKTVIMTDADVDGAHIATLILTFFFRQMRPVVEEGHLYLAVPPLYRIRRKGEEDLYVRTERDLTTLFVDRALAARAVSDPDGPVDGHGMRPLLDPLIAASGHLDAALRLLRHPALADAILGEPLAGPLFGMKPLPPAQARRIEKALLRRLADMDPDARWTASIRGCGLGYAVDAKRIEDEIGTDHSLCPAELNAPAVRALRDAWDGSDLSGLVLTVGGAPVQGPIGLMGSLRRAGSKGAQVSRYKGLGEMNPDELWETTMNPATRALRRVRIEDAEKAEAIFSDLMADNVAARRALIEEMCAGPERLDI